MKNFPYYKQAYLRDCGITCLRMIAEFYDKPFSSKLVTDISVLNRDGMTLFDIGELASVIGIKTEGREINIDMLNKIGFPVIAHWNNNHFVVLYKIFNGYYFIADPAIGLIRLSKPGFLHLWRSTILNDGIILRTSITNDF